MNAALRAQAQWREELARERTALADTRIRHLFIVRESGTGSNQLLEGLLERTLALYLHVPGADHILEAGLGPLQSPTEFPTSRIFKLPMGGSAALWSVSGTYVLYVLGSAAKNDAVVDDDGTRRNSVSVLLRRILESLRPEEVLIGPFDRVVRGFDQDSYTFGAFKANVRVLRFAGHRSIDFRSPDCQSKWREQSDKAITMHQVTLEKLGDGRAGRTRRGFWTMAPTAAPPGLTAHKKQLVVALDELPWVGRAVELIAQSGFTVAGGARQLIAEGLIPPRRSRTEIAPGFRSLGDGQLVSAAEGAENLRVEDRLRRLFQLLPDLFLGKFVYQWTQTESGEAEYLGLRRVFDENGGYVHQMVYDVPDVFHASDPAILERAVRAVVSSKLAGDRPPSDWLIEVGARQAARKVLEASDTPALERDEIIRWAGEDGSSIDRLAPSTPARMSRLLQIIAQESSRLPAGPSQPPSQRLNRLFIGRPPWSDGEGSEWCLKWNNDNYAVLRRQADPRFRPQVSLARAWAHRTTQVGKGDVVAAVPMLELHAGIAGAIAEALDRGAPLAPDQRTASALLGSVSDGRVLAADHEMHQVENQLRVAKVRAEAAGKVLIDLHVRRAMQQTLESDEENAARLAVLGGGVSDAMLDAHIRSESAMWEEAASLERRLSVLHAAQQSSPQAVDTDMLDLELVLRVLAWVATTKKAESSIVAKLQDLIVEFRVTSVSTFFVQFTVTVNLPSKETDDGVTIGPIFGRARTAGAIAPSGQTWPAAITQYLCIESTVAADVYMGLPGSGSRASADTNPEDLVKRAAQRHLVELGMTREAAWNVLTCPLMPLRTVVWTMATGAVLDHTQLRVSPEYVDLVRRVFLSGRPLKSPLYASDRRPRQTLLDLILEAGGIIHNKDLLARSYLANRPNEASALRSLSARLTHCPDEREMFTVHVRRGHKHFYSARTCQHCKAEGVQAFVDICVWVPEIESGLLCSTCLRQPTPSSITYPEFYRQLPQLLSTAKAPVASHGQGAA